jgi:hypothetical protein
MQWIKRSSFYPALCALWDCEQDIRPSVRMYLSYNKTLNGFPRGQCAPPKICIRQIRKILLAFIYLNTFNFFDLSYRIRSSKACIDLNGL